MLFLTVCTTTRPGGGVVVGGVQDKLMCGNQTAGQWAPEDEGVVSSEAA